MQIAKCAVLWLLAASIFTSILFVDFLPLPVGAYASQRFLLAGLLISVVSLGSAAYIYRSGWLGLKNLWSVLLLAAGFIVLSLPFGNAPYNWAEPGMYVLYFLGFVIVGHFPASQVSKQYLVVCVAYTGAVAAVFYGGATITVYLFALSDQVARLSNYIPWGFVSIRYWSHVATWLIPLLPLAVIVGPLQHQRLWLFFVALGAALWWWIVFLSSSRGTMLGLAFGVLLAAVMIGRPALPWLKVFIRYLAYGVLAWLLLSVLIPSLLLDEVSMRTLKTDTSGRMPLFLEAWRMSLQNFPFGQGPQSWLTHEILTESYQQSRKFGHPHNMYLMWAAEYGWLLIAGLAMLVAQAARLFWLKRAEVRAGTNDGLALPLAAFTASVSAALLHAGVSAVFMAPGSMLVGFMVLCVFWALITSSPPKAISERPKSRFGAAVLVGLCMSLPCFYWLGSVINYHKAMKDDLEYYYENVPSGTLPRFWFHGNFPRHPSQMPQ